MTINSITKGRVVGNLRKLLQKQFENKKNIAKIVVEINANSAVITIKTRCFDF